MSVLIKGGRIVTASEEYVGDVFVDNELMRDVDVPVRLLVNTESRHN